VKRHQIIVGNIGTVTDTDDSLEAHRSYIEYCKQSRDNSGRAAGESVAWFRDGDIYAKSFEAAGNTDPAGVSRLSMAEIKSTYARVRPEGKWFSNGGFHRTTFHGRAYQLNTTAWFVSGDRAFDDSQRYTVRAMDVRTGDFTSARAIRDEEEIDVCWNVGLPGGLTSKMAVGRFETPESAIEFLNWILGVSS